MREARPTEYAGVVFKSKSEAVIARGIDLEAGALWIYEPYQWQTADKWIPDFWVILPNRKSPGFTSFCIEYKPKRPTGTYMEEARKRFLSISDRLGGTGEAILYGSPFDLSVERGGLFLRVSADCYENNRLVEEPKYVWEEGEFSRLTQHWDEAVKYRFDLDGGPR